MSVGRTGRHRGLEHIHYLTHTDTPSDVWGRARRASGADGSDEGSRYEKHRVGRHQRNVAVGRKYRHRISGAGREGEVEDIRCLHAQTLQVSQISGGGGEKEDIHALPACVRGERKRASTAGTGYTSRSLQLRGFKVSLPRVPESAAARQERSSGEETSRRWMGHGGQAGDRCMQQPLSTLCRRTTRVYLTKHMHAGPVYTSRVLYTSGTRVYLTKHMHAGAFIPHETHACRSVYTSRTQAFNSAAPCNERS